MIVACIVALNLDKLAAHWKSLVLVIALFDLSGFILGYLAARALRQPERFCRTVSIEVGMQNSGLAVALANKMARQLWAIWTKETDYNGNDRLRFAA